MYVIMLSIDYYHGGDLINKNIQLCTHLFGDLPVEVLPVLTSFGLHFNHIFWIAHVFLICRLGILYVFFFSNYASSFLFLQPLVVHCWTHTDLSYLQAQFPAFALVEIPSSLKHHVIQPPSYVSSVIFNFFVHIERFLFLMCPTQLRLRWAIL